MDRFVSYRESADKIMEPLRADCEYRHRILFLQQTEFYESKVQARVELFLQSKKIMSTTTEVWLTKRVSGRYYLLPVTKVTKYLIKKRDLKFLHALKFFFFFKDSLTEKMRSFLSS